MLEMLHKGLKVVEGNIVVEDLGQTKDSTN